MENQAIKDVRNVAKGITESISFPVFLEKWRTFSRILGINEIVIMEIDRKRRLFIMEPNEVPFELLKFWRAERGSKDATMDKLTDALVESGLRDIAESLENNMNMTMTAKTDSIVEKILKLVKDNFNVNLLYCTMNTIYSGISPRPRNYSPLHLAIRYGEFEMAIYLIKEYGTNVKDLKCLVHTCVSESVTDPESVVQSKCKIISEILKVNPDGIHEKDEDECTPILQENVHINILKCLLQCGGNINDYSQQFGTVLLRRSANTGKNTYKEFVRWTFFNGFQLINHRNMFGRNVLMHVLSSEFEHVVDCEILELFYIRGINLNVKDVFGKTILLQCLERSTDTYLMQKLIKDCKVDVHVSDKAGKNAAFKVMEGKLEHSQLVFSVLMWLEDEGFNQFSKCFKGQTILDAARKYIDREDRRDDDGLFMLLHYLEVKMTRGKRRSKKAEHLPF